MAEKTTIARPYAQAVIDLAKESGEMSKWSQMLELAAAVAADPTMDQLIHSPRIEAEELLTVFLDVCGDKLNDTGKNMVRVLADNDRLSLLPEIAELFEQQRAESEGTVKAEVISATPLSDAQQSALAQALKKRLGREISLDCTTDESLLGGAIIRAGDTVIDGSAVGRLEKLKLELMH